MSVELLATAKLLAEAGVKRPRQSDLKRAISTAYYALFDQIARDAANLLVGAASDSDYGIWRQTYRALDHGNAKNACALLKSLGFPESLCHCGEAFILLQAARHKADYDPYHRVSRADAFDAITLADTAIGNLTASTRRDRKAFAVQLLLKRR